jgi:hypothetical protein
LSDPYYPQLDTATIKALPIMQQLSEEHKAYLLTAPYGGDVLAILERLFAPKKVIHEQANAPEQDDGEDNWEFLARESKRLYIDLSNTGLGLEGSDKLAYLKTAAGLLEKLLSMQERANNLKQISEFYALIMTIMEEELSSDQRSKIMIRLEEAIKA